MKVAAAVLFLSSLALVLGYEAICLVWRGPTRPTWSAAAWAALDLLGRWKWALAGPLGALMVWAAWHWAFEQERGPWAVLGATAASIAAGLLTIALWPK
jgi:hypothetical protein